MLTDDEKRELIAEARERYARAKASVEAQSPMAQAQMILVAGFVPKLLEALEGTLAEPDAAGVLKAAQSEAARRTAHTLGERPEWVDGYRAGFVDATGWVAGGGH